MEPARYQCGTFEIDAENRRLSNGEAEIPLENKAFAVLLELLRRPGSLVTRDALLDAVWGHRFVTPSTLNRAIALARRALDDDAEEPRFVQTVHGAGYRFIGPVERIARSAPAAQARFAPPPPARLPVRVVSLIGREQELEQMAALLAEHRAVTVLGTGGMGKTVCTLEAARRCAASYPDGVWFFDLAPVQDADEWLRSLASSLLVEGRHREELLAKICELLSGRRALLVLDNCDRIAVSVGALVLALLRGTEEVKVFCTSQQPLGFVGEQIMPMPPLQLPDADWDASDDPAAVQAISACALLVERVRGLRPDFTVTPDNGPAIVDICRQLDGMPLALELAAARFVLLSPEQVLVRLTERFRFLESAAVGLDPRHASLVTLLGWSYALLSSAEQRLLAWLSVFVQGWTIEAAIDLAADLGHESSEAVDLLSGLVNKSFVTVDRAASPIRYRLLESVKEFAIERLRDSGEEQQAQIAHLEYVRGLSEAISRDVVVGRMGDGASTLVREAGNITSALKFAAAAPGHSESAHAIVGALVPYLKSIGGSLAVRYGWCDLAVDEDDHRKSGVTARALLAKGVLTAHTRGSAAAILAAAAARARAEGDRWADAYASGYHAMCQIDQGDIEAARTSAAVTARLAETLDDPQLRGLSGIAEAWICLADGAAGDALQALLPVRRLGTDIFQQIFIEIYIGLAEFGLGNGSAAAERALEVLQRSLAIDAQNIRPIAGACEICAYVAVQRRLFVDGAQMLGSAEYMRDRTGMPLFRLWLPLHEHAQKAAERALGAAEYAKQFAVGWRRRHEDAVNRAEELMESLCSGRDSAEAD